MDKKISLEHTIRNVVIESVGAIGTDKFTKTGNSFFKSVHIEPKRGDEHTDGTRAVRASRNVQKERSSQTMKEALTPKKGETQVDLGYDPAGEMTPEEKSRREAAKKKIDQETAKNMKFDPTKPYIISRERSPSEKIKDVIQDTLSKSPAYKDIAAQKTKDISDIANVSGVGLVGSALDMLAHQSRVNKTGKIPGRAYGTGIKPVETDKTGLETFKKGEEQAAASKSAKDLVVGTLGAIAGGKALGALMGTEGGAAVSKAAKDIIPPSFFGKQKTSPTVSTTKVEPPKLVSTRAETPKIEIPKTVNKTISDIMKRPDLGDAANVNKPKSVETPSVANVKPEKVEPLPQTGGKGKKPEAETVEPQTQGNLALKPKQSEVPSASPEKPLKFDKPGQDVVPVEKPTSTKPYKPKTMTPDEIAKEMDKFKRQQAPVTEPPSKKSIDPKEFFGKPAPESIKPPANVNNKTPAVTPAPVKTAPAVTPATKLAPAVSRPAAAPDAAPQTANAPAAAPALAPAAAAAPALAPAAQTAAQQAQKKIQKKEEVKRFKRGAPIGLPGVPVSPDVISGLKGFVPVKPYLHFAQDYVQFGEAVGNADEERKSIENVARPGGKTRVTKQAEIKNKIIDENVKRAKTIRKVISDKKESTVILKPKLENPELDEN